MRVITGYAKGHNLMSLEGTETRPTTDKVKEAMFSTIQFNIEDSVVLDLYAGSGALGIEALSRSAKWCDFVENNKAAIKVIESNLQKTRLDNCEIYHANANDYLTNCKKKYDIVFLDPPYKKGLCDTSMELLYQQNLLNEGALIICETSTSETISSRFNIIKQAKYGTVKITVYENI